MILKPHKIAPVAQQAAAAVKTDHSQRLMSALDVMDDAEVFKPDPAFMSIVEGELAKLATGIEKLTARAQADIESADGKRESTTMQSVIQSLESAQLRTALGALPAEPVTIFTEFDELCITGNIEQALLGDKPIEGRDERLAAWQGLQMSMDEAIAKLEAEI